MFSQTIMYEFKYMLIYKCAKNCQYALLSLLVPFLVSATF